MDDLLNFFTPLVSAWIGWIAKSLWDKYKRNEPKLDIKVTTYDDCQTGEEFKKVSIQFLKTDSNYILTKIGLSHEVYAITEKQELIGGASTFTDQHYLSDVISVDSLGNIALYAKNISYDEEVSEIEFGIPASQNIQLSFRFKLSSFPFRLVTVAQI